MKVPFVDLKAQYLSIKPEIDEAIQTVIDSSRFVLGEAVSGFEKDFADYCGKKHCIALNSGTDALYLAMLSLNLKKGDEVITTPNTFIATATAVSHAGARPVFVDCDKKTYNIDVNKIKRAITQKTKAIIPVHLYGQPADMQPIVELAEEHNIAVVEDCAQAHGAEYKNKKVPVSDTACFSFYPSKPLGAFGEGGAIVTNNEELAERISIWRDQGQSKKYVHKYTGFNTRMHGIQGAVLGVKLKHIDKWNEFRIKNAKLYNELLGNVCITPYEAGHAKHVYHLYVIKAKNRDKLKSHLDSKNIGTGMHYPIPIHLQEAYKHLGLKQGSFPETESYVKEILSLPMYAELTQEQIKYVVESIKQFYK
jgi:dTDP-4-amino-4,6-dideoxygalactose transaminase